ncbi:hypothetical protein [Tautonia plasticadhaerens]|uniref:Uncharacterized protein n=1 Tax=Tautonia plasticadhaerens TaxID=2527974 RepID=A0A518HAF0_9BACT|nr:hypothetical protein [Tautonia plasticadhaerens]QDV37831.1 hypothetical protein ElP_57780 [Tautonia plasticadhaerens]
MGLFGKAKKFVKGLGPAEPVEPQAFRVSCPEGHVIRGRRTEGYQALRCPDCGAGVFVLPQSPLPMPPAPATRADEAAVGAGGPSDDAPIPLADHVPEGAIDEGEVEWLEPVEPGAGLPGEQPTPAFDPVEAAVSELPEGEEVPEPPRRPPTSPTTRPRRPAPAPAGDRGRPSPPRPTPQGPRPARPGGRRILVPDRPSLRDRVRRNRPMLVGLAMVVVVLGTAAFSIYRNARRDYPTMVQRGRDEGIPALEDGDFDLAHRLLSRAAEAVEALGGQIGGAEEVRQAAREAAIFVDLIPDRLEAILDERARTVDESRWQSTFDRFYRGRSILLSAEVTGTPAASGRFEINYRVLNRTATSPRVARIDFEGFRLFESGSPEVGARLQFGARLEAIWSEEGGYRIQLQPESGVTITHVEALDALGWRPIEAAALRPIDPPPPHPILLATLLTPPPPPPAQDLKGQTREQVQEQLGTPRSYARSASQGESIEQWIFDGPSGTRQYINFRRSTGRSGPAVVDDQFFLR